jgi:hypothetical protein
MAMRRKILLSLFALLVVGGVVSASKNACAQRRGGARPAYVRGGYGFSRGRYVSPYGFSYPYLPTDSDFGGSYGYAPQPVYFVQQPPAFDEPPATPAVRAPWHPVVTEYKWPATAAVPAPSSSETENQTLAIVLKDGSTLSAVSVFATDDGLHYVDPDARHMHIAMSEVDRAATLKLNHARNLDLYLPAAQ